MLARAEERNCPARSVARGPRAAGGCGHSSSGRSSAALDRRGQLRQRALQVAPLHAATRESACGSALRAWPVRRSDRRAARAAAGNRAVRPRASRHRHSSRTMARLRRDRPDAARDLPPPLAAARGLDVGLPGGHFGFEPARAVQLGQPRAQLGGHLRPGSGRRPARIRSGRSTAGGGASRCAFRLCCSRMPSSLDEQRAVAGRILEARPGRRRSARRTARPAAGPTARQAEQQFLAAGMHDRLVPGRGQQLPRTACTSRIGLRIDHGQAVAGGHLDQAQLGPIGVLGDELRVEGDRRRVGQFAAELPQLAIGRDVIVMHSVERARCEAASDAAAERAFHCAAPRSVRCYAAGSDCTTPAAAGNRRSIRPLSETATRRAPGSAAGSTTL